MVVKELIALLQTMPQDALVICDYCSDYAKMTTDDIKLMEPKDGAGLIEHHGHIMDFSDKWRTVVPSENPTFITAVHFHGN